jgi:hypothetical protein
MKIEFCSDSPDALISLIEAVKLRYWKPPDKLRKRGRENTFSELSFLLLAVVSVVTKTFSDSALYRLLKSDKQRASRLRIYQSSASQFDSTATKTTCSICRRTDFALWSAAPGGISKR